MQSLQGFTLHPAYMSTTNVPAASVPVCSVACEKKWLQQESCLVFDPSNKENNSSNVPESPTTTIVLEFLVKSGSIVLEISISDQERWSTELGQRENFPLRALFMFSNVLEQRNQRTKRLFTQRHKLHCNPGHARRNLQQLLPPRVFAQLELARWPSLC